MSSMASQSISSTPSSPNWCFCGWRAVIRTSCTTKNSRRRFSACDTNRELRGCNYFSWIDMEVPEMEKNVINELKVKLSANKYELENVRRRLNTWPRSRNSKRSLLPKKN